MVTSRPATPGAGRSLVTMFGAAPLPPFEFVVQPEGGYLNGSTGQYALRVVVPGASSYQWQTWDGASLWSDVADATSASLAATAEGIYSCVATGDKGVIRSHAVNVAAQPAPLDGITFSGNVYSASRDLLSSFTSARYTEVSGAVSALAEQKGGEAVDFTQGTAGNRPTIVTVNGRSMIRFDGTDDRLTGGTTNDLIFNNLGLVFISGVVRAVTTNNANAYDNHVLFGDADAFWGIHLKISGGNVTVMFFNYDGSSDVANKVIASASLIDVPAVYEWWHTGGNVGGSFNDDAATPAASGDTNSVAHPVSLGDTDTAPALQVDIDTAIFIYTAITSEQRGDLIADMKAWAEGSFAESWYKKRILPYFDNWGAPWTPSASGAEITAGGHNWTVQRDDAAAWAFGVAMDNPDWLNGFRFEHREGDLYNAATKRSEIASTANDCVNGETLYGSFWCMIEEGSALSDEWNSFGQVHQDGALSNDASQPLAFEVYDGYLGTPQNWSVTTRHSTDSPVTTNPRQVRYTAPDSLASEMGTPFHVVFQVCFDPSGTGSVLKVWRNGIKVVDITDPIGFTVSEGYYFKCGVYRGGSATDPVIVQYSGVEVGQDPAILERITNPLRCPFA
jgi:hypothetical protein